MKSDRLGENRAGQSQRHQILFLDLGKSSIQSSLMSNLYDSNVVELGCHHEGCGAACGFVVPARNCSLLCFEMAAQVELDEAPEQEGYHKD